MLVNPREIAPSQDFLKEKTVRFILECLRSGNVGLLPPTPIVRQDAFGNLVAIDGHNLLAVKAYHNQQQEVHVAESAEDGLPAEDEATRPRNQDLKDKFQSSLADRDSARSKGIESFDDLIEQYSQLFKENG